MVEEYAPPFLLVSRVAAALEKELGRRLDLRDIVCENAAFPTKFCCEVVGCKGCLPAISERDWHALKDIYKTVRPGEWICSRYPNGLIPEGDIHG